MPALVGRASVALALAVLALCGLTAAAPAAPAADVVWFEHAQGLLEPDGAAPVEGVVDLSRRWDIDFPGQGGHAVYRITLPPQTGTEPMALLFSRVGNQVLIQVNGHTVQRFGVLGEEPHDAAKSAVMVAVPAAFLQADKPNELRVEVTVQALRLGGLSVLGYGPYARIAALYDEHHFWRHSALVGYTVTRIGMGLFALLLWWRQRDAFYACFGIATLLGAVRTVERLLPEIPVPWPHLGVLVGACYAVHIALSCRFMLMALGPVSSRMNRLINTVIALELLLTLLAYELSQKWLLTLAIAIATPLGLITFGVILREALRWRSRTAWVLAATVALAVAAGMYDFLLLRGDAAGGLRATLSQHALFVFILVMAVLIAERYNRSVANFRALSTELGQRVDERERQLRDAFDSLRAQQHEQSIANERQRIMRELHDGVGSQLVGLLNMVARPGADPAVLTQQVQQALDEMRMSVDSLQPAHDDLVTVLATLRYRLQPRLQAAGIEVVWDVAELPALRQLAPHEVLQIQRILLEAFTNVLKHSRAAQVTVRARCDAASEPVVKLQISDNGVGLGTGTASLRSQGHGIVNMQARAASIGALLRVAPQAGGGACVALEWQVRPASAAVLG